MTRASKTVAFEDIIFQEESISYVVVSYAKLGKDSVELRFYPSMDVEVLIVEKGGVTVKTTFDQDADMATSQYMTELDNILYGNSGYYSKIRNAHNKRPATPASPGSGDFS